MLQKFLDIWKKEKNTSLYKSNDQTKPNNYRRITILPIISKIMERIVHRQVYKFLQEHNLIISEQFGFRPNLSTNDSLTRVTEEILLIWTKHWLPVLYCERPSTQLITAY